MTMLARRSKRILLLHHRLRSPSRDRTTHMSQVTLGGGFNPAPFFHVERVVITTKKGWSGRTHYFRFLFFSCVFALFISSFSLFLFEFCLLIGKGDGIIMAFLQKDQGRILTTWVV
ncbi:hypothetical protein K449DRAFT_194336 [Hypoxylon sp. EC38]|nr:hypothetical protein K449DRAFT_194336 [Hypoxylon sp. EC38]